MKEWAAAGERTQVTEAGATASFEAFFEMQQVRLYRALYLVTGSAHEAEDLSQEAFLQVWQRWDRVATMDDPVGYLYRTAMNGFRSRHRRAARWARRVVRAVPPPDLFAEADVRDQVARAMRDLSLRQRTALVLTELLGYSSEEAGQLMGVKAGTVRALDHQARDALRTSLGVEQ